ncbi:MAG: 3-phosphoserine/phosphohydroxythreonine transaminase [Gammaproteobacteria bacterium]
MERAYNFSPGPCGLPDEVMERAREEFLSYGGEGASVMEISHRGPAFMEIYERAHALLRELLGIGEEYAVLFLTGGATGQAAMAPINLIPDERRTAAYLITGHWSRRAAEEAKKYCRVQIVGDTADGGYTSLPEKIAPAAADAAYLHYADNETIHGVEFPRPPSSDAPLLADMSSNILSRPLNIADYGLIYAGAQKNLGPAGLTIVIVRKSLINSRPQTPVVWNYREKMERDSMINTPPTFSIYMTGLVLEWVKREGGAAEMARRSDEKARLLYECIDGGFYRNDVGRECRSRMNIPFFLPDESLTGEFLAGARENGMVGLKGHAVLGGCRASLYNSMPVAGVRVLTEYMRDFAQRRG